MMMIWTDHHIKKESNKKHEKFLSSYDYSTEIPGGGTRASELVNFVLKEFPIKTRCQSFSTYIIFREEITAKERAHDCLNVYMESIQKLKIEQSLLHFLCTSLLL